MNNFEVRIQDLPAPAKTFVGLFCALMLCVVGWAVWIYVVENQRETVSRTNQSSQATNSGLQTQAEPPTVAKSPEQLQAGELQRLRRLKHNVALAHTHINGQTLLFFATGLVFLFTSVPAKIKKIVFWVFGLSVIIHNIGLSGHGVNSLYDDMLAVSGVLILVSILYIVLMVFVDLGKHRTPN